MNSIVSFALVSSIVGHAPQRLDTDVILKRSDSTERIANDRSAITEDVEQLIANSHRVHEPAQRAERELVDHTIRAHHTPGALGSNVC